MRFISLVLSVAILLGCCTLAGCTPKMDQKIREKTDLGMDTLVKAKDRGQDAALIANLTSDPVLDYYYKKNYFTGSVSHGVVTLTGRLRLQKQIDLAVELASRVKGVKEVINEIELDPDMEESPIDDIWY